ncbi:hypothetical protein ACFLT5_03470 [Chloroflexota bacterium]
MTTRRETGSHRTYRIMVKGTLDTKWSDWFNGFTITPLGSDETLLTGPVADQAALHGLLAKIRDLGLPLLSVIRVEDDASTQGGSTLRQGPKPAGQR